MKPSSLRIAACVLVGTGTLACQLLAGGSQGPATSAGPSPEASPAASTATSAPTGLNADGPYVVFGGAGGMWIANPDGTFLTQVTSIDLSQTDLREALSPNGKELAVVVRGPQGPDLVEVGVPGGETNTLAHLLDITQDQLAADATGGRAQAYYAIVNYNSVAWQPGSGGLLAFMGAVKGPTSDLYVYDPASKKITQLTDGPSQAILPSWSPDGQYVLHYGVSWVPPFGGVIAGYNQLDGIWAVRIADQEVIPQPKPKAQFIHFVGWWDQSHYVTYDSDDTPGDVVACANSNLHSVDVSSGKTVPIMPWDFNGIAFSPVNRALFFDSKSACKDSPGDGIFWLAPGETTPAKLTSDIPYEYHWLPESQVMQAYPQALFSIDGKTRYDPPNLSSSFHPAVSKRGFQAWDVIQNQQGSLQVKTQGADWKTIMNGMVAPLIWDPVAGDTLFIASEDGTLYAAKYPDFTPRALGKTGGVNQTMWLP